MVDPYVIEIAKIPEVVVPGKRLGRHVVHDSRSKRFAVRPVGDIAIRSIQHERFITVMDQKDVGACTGFALVGAMGTGTLFHSIHNSALANLKILILDGTLAYDIYASATQIDPFPGSWLPDDTGSNGLSVAKVAKDLGYINGYTHCLSLDAVNTALQSAPVIAGTNWYEGMDKVSVIGKVYPTGQARGGHEYVIDGTDITTHEFHCTNSWGSQWGHNGGFYISWDDFDQLMHEDGDVTVLNPLTAPVPVPVPVVEVEFEDTTPADMELAAAANLWLSTTPRFYKRGIQTSLREWLAVRNFPKST